MAQLILSDAQLDRYARHIVLREIGGSGQARLLASRIAVVGAGGIGAPALLYLAAAGVGHVRLIDDDRVSASNLQRQILFTRADIGEAKVLASAAAIDRMGGDCRVEAIDRRVDADNAEALLDGVDAVIDGTDSFDARAIVAGAAHRLRIPLISAAVGQFEGQLGVFRGWEPDLPCYRCWVGDDPGRAGTSCADDGVIGALTGILGSMAALEAIRAVVPFGDDPAGRILLADLAGFRFRTLALPPDPGCTMCGAPR